MWFFFQNSIHENIIGYVEYFVIIHIPFESFKTIQPQSQGMLKLFITRPALQKNSKLTHKQPFFIIIALFTLGCFELRLFKPLLNHLQKKVLKFNMSFHASVYFFFQNIKMKWYLSSNHWIQEHWRLWSSQ